jgi:hypothetical protein
LLIVAAALCAPPTGSGAGISGDINSGSKTIGVGKGGNSAFFAFSELTKPAAGPNQSSRYEVLDNGKLVNPPPLNPVPEPKVQINVGFNGKTFSYTPLVKLDPVPKPTPTISIQQLVSTSGNILAEGAARGDAAYVVFNKGDFLTADGNLFPKNQAITGKAAGASFDPYQVSVGSHPYQQTIDAKFDLGNPTQSGGLTYYAVDSRFTDVDTFFERGQPFSAALWALSIVAPGGPVKSVSDLQVNFMVNPLARSTGDFNPSLTDAQIQAAVESAIVVKGGGATLTNFALFPSGTTLNVSASDGPIEFGTAVNAGFQGTASPEPASVVLAASGVLAVALYGVRRRRPKNPCADYQRPVG